MVLYVDGIGWDLDAVKYSAPHSANKSFDFIASLKLEVRLQA